MPGIASQAMVDPGDDALLDFSVHVPDLLAACFEGLGDKCELGIAQSFCGAEPLGLLRFASLPIAQLIALLDSDFAALDAPDEIDVFLHDDGAEWWGRVAACSLEYHTGRAASGLGRVAALRGERLRIRFLTRKLLDQLRDPHKIFVRRDIDASVSDIADLTRALMRHGDHKLLWVDHTTQGDRIGAVEPAGDRVAHGWLGHFWPDAAPSPGGLGIWIKLLRSALAILDPGRVAMLQRAARKRATACRNHVTISDWRNLAAARSDISDAVPSPGGGHPVSRHVLLADTSQVDGLVVGCRLCADAADCLFVLSAQVWLPTGFHGYVFLAAPGFGWIRMWPADIRRRACWQKIVTSIRLPSSPVTLYPGLMAVAPAGSVFFSADLRIERGVVPGDCLPSIDPADG